MAKEVKLFGTWASPYSRRVEMALKLKGVEYEYFEEDLYSKSPLLLQYNPVHQKIPVLVHNGKPIAESQIIIEYIDETWTNNPILPQDPYDRAVARFWANFIDEKLMSLSWTGKLKKGGDEAIKEYCELLKTLENELKGKDFFGGESVGFVDIVGTVVAFWLGVYQEVLEIELITAETLPELHQWIEKLLSVEAIVQSRPPREKHVEHVRIRFAALAAAAEAGSK